MSQNSEQTEHCTNPSTETARTDETTRDTHLNRLHEVVYLLGYLRGGALKDNAKREAKRLREQVASLQWAIEELKP